MGLEQAIDFCDYLAKTKKYEGDGTEFVQLAELLRFLADDQENSARNEYIVDHMSSDEAAELGAEYDALEEDEAD